MSAFEFTINTALGAGKSFDLPLRQYRRDFETNQYAITNNYNFVVDWGDGNTNTITSYNQTEKFHTYSTSGVYTISITGLCEGWCFNDEGDRLKLTSIEQWGNTGFVDMEFAFRGCKNLTSVNDTDGTWCSNVNNMRLMFYLCTSLETIDVSNWDVSNVIYINYIFQNCTSLTTLDVSNWNVSNATTMSFMFWNCPLLTTLDVSNWDVSNVTNMGYMFENCTSLTTLDVSNWDVSKVIGVYGMRNMFSNTPLDTTSYDALLIGWSQLPSLKSNVVLDANLARYSSGAAANARQYIIDTYGWTFNDAGKTVARPFTFTIDTTLGTGNSFNLPLRSGYNYDFVVNWGDGNTNRITSYNQIEKLHTYSTGGEYQVKITGLCETLYFNNGGDKLKLTSIDQWGNTGFINMEGSFNGCSNLITANDTNGTWCSNVVSMKQMFVNCSSLATLDVSNWDVSKVTHIGGMFGYCSSLTTLNVSNWNTSKVTDTNGMFWGCSSLATLDVSNWDVSNVNSTNGMFGMFWDCTSLTTLDLSNWDVSNVTDISGMFYGCSSLTTLDLSKWNVSNAIYMDYMFYNAPLDTTSYDALLNGWSGLPSLQPNINFLANLTKYSCAAEEAHNTLTSSPNNWSITDAGLNVVSCDGDSFKFTIDTSKGTGSSFNLPLRSGFNYDFVVDWGDGTNNAITSYNQAEKLHTYSTGGVYQISIIGLCESWYFNNGGDKLKLTSIDNWGDTGFVNMEVAFRGCSNLTTINDTNGTWCSNVTNMKQMFLSCSSLETLNASNWELSNLTNMGGMFGYCSSLTTLDVNNWDVSNVSDVNGMFFGCSSLETLDVSNWDVSNVNNMYTMFWGCSSLETLDVSNWDVSNVTDMGTMFGDCTSLTTLNINNWNASKVNYMDSMFQNCYNLKQLDFSNWTFPDWTLPDFNFYYPYTFYNFLKDTPLNVTSYTSLLIRLNQTLNLGDKEPILEMLDANLCKYDCRYTDIRNNLFNRIKTINDIGCVEIQDYSIYNININGKQYDTFNLGKWFYQVNWTNSFNDSNNSNFKLEFKYNRGDYFELPVDTNTSSKALVGSSILRSDEEYEIRINYKYDVYSKPVKFRTSDIDFPISIMYDDAKFFEQTINWTLSNQEHYYNCKVYIQVDGLGLFLINPNSDYLDSNNFNLTGLRPNTEYTWRFRIIHSNQYHDRNRIYISNDYSFTTKKLPKHLCEYDVTVINADCNSYNGVIYINGESGYSRYDYAKLFDYNLQYFDYDTNTIINNTTGNFYFNALESGYYHLTITPKPIVWFYYGREGCVKEWIKLENDDSTVGVNSIISKPAICSGFDNQPGRLQVQLDGVLPYYKYWFFNSDGLLIENKTTTNPYIVLNNATECYYGVIEDSNGCRYLMDKVCIPTDTSSSISGIKQLFIAPVTGDIDFDYYNTQDDDYYLDGEDNSFFMSTKISRINTVLSWYKIPIHNGQVNFKQELNKNRQGFIFSDVMEVGIAHQTQEKLNTLLRNLLNKFIVVFQDANGNWWISGYTSHASLDTVVLTTGRRYDSNQYTLNITSNSADNIITNINEDWVNNNILN